MNDQELIQENKGVGIFIQVLQKYLPFWPIFVLTIGISLSVSYVYLRSQIPIFVASAKILLKDPSKASGESKIIEQMNIFGEKKVVENELLVLRSTGLMEKVVKDLDLYVSYYNQGKVRIEELYQGSSPIKLEAVDNPDSIRYAMKFSFKVDWAQQRVQIAGQSVPFDSTLVLQNLRFRIIPNGEYNTGLVGKNYFLLIKPVPSAAGELIGPLRASPQSNTSSVIDVKLEGPEPRKSRDVLARLFEVYNVEGIKDKNQVAKRTLDFIDDRLDLVKDELDSVERSVRDFKLQSGVFDLSQQSGDYVESIRNDDEMQAQIDLQLTVLNDIRLYVISKGKKPGTVPALGLVSDPILSKLVNELYETEFSLDALLATTGKSSERVRLEEDKIRRIKTDILENIANIKGDLLGRRSLIAKRMDERKSRLVNLPQQEQELMEITRQQGIKNSIYSFLLQKREETAISSAATSADLRVLEEPSYGGPIRPISKNFYLTGFIIGLLAAVGYVLAKEHLVSVVLFRQEIEDKAKAPIVAEIIQGRLGQNIVIAEGKRTVVAEQFRTLRTNLAYMGLDGERKKVLLCTSSVSGEGKSFMALNLAISLTLAGKKVALLELDLRKPKLSKQLDVPREPGISNFMIRSSSYDEIQRNTGIPNLTLFPSGTIPPNPTELIQLPDFDQFFERLKQEFDFVVVDTAPVAPVTDSLLLSKFADVSLYVVRHDKTPKIFLRMIGELYEQKKFPSMGIVFNGLKKRGITVGLYASTYGYGYGYGYGHGYGYGYGYALDETDSLWGKVKYFATSILRKIRN